MRRAVPCIAIVIVSLASLVAGQRGPASSNSDRKVILRVAPSYPVIAKKMHLEGAVKMEVEVRADGSVESTRVLGGHPVLVLAATEAVGRWKFEPGPNKTAETIQVTFALQ